MSCAGVPIKASRPHPMWRQAGRDRTMTTAGHQQSAPTQAAFIDSRVPNMRARIDGATSGTVVFVLNTANDGVRQIADILMAESLHDLTSIAFVAHGSAGHIDLGA